ncbi:MAG: hypothetical protein QOG54_225 [Actinomycetota bacterium]|nr:hypothetical protein [Actinomycetota bacterium]
MKTFFRRIALVMVPALIAGIAGIAPGRTLLATAAPNPVAVDENTYQAFGRVFPDPQGCLAYNIPDANADGRKDTPRGVSPWAKGRACADQFLSYQEVIDGAKFLEARFPRFMHVIRLDQAFDNPNYRSAGIPRGISFEDGQAKVLGRDRRPLYILKVTDGASETPETERHHFAYSLSIHGIERAGLEGGARAMEDLVTWAACEVPAYVANTPACTAEGPFPKKIVETPTDRPVPTAGEVLKSSVMYFVLSNPDGWARGQTAPVEIEDGSPNASYAPGAMFQRFNGNGVDLNRDFPTIGYTYRPYSPGSEPETKAFTDVLSQIRSRLPLGHFTGGLDLHGMLTARAFSYTLLGAGQHDFRKNAITQETALRTWQDQTQRLAWSPWIADANANGQLDSGETAVSEPAFGGRVPAPVADAWGSVIDTLGYQITGGFGDWFDSPLGLDAVGIDNEMYASHLAPNNVFEPALEQTHIDGNKGLIYSQIAALLIEDDHVFHPGGKVGYIYNPKRIQVEGKDRLPNPGLPAQNNIEVIMPCSESGPQNVDGSCQGAHFALANNLPTLEFDVKGPEQEIWNGGISVEVTAPNVAAISPGALGNVSLDYLDEGQWATIATSRTSEGTNYSQAGKIVTVNDPQPGRWRVRLLSQAQMPARVKVDFNPTTAEASPGQAPIDASSMDFFSDLNKYTPEGERLSPVNVEDVAADPEFARQFDSIVVVNNIGSRSYITDQLGLAPEQADAYFSNLRHFVETGGNLVLTDAALQALSSMNLLPADAVKNGNTLAGSYNFSLLSGAAGPITYKDAEKWPLAKGVNLPGASEGTAGRRQAAEPTPLGYTPDTGLDSTPQMPIWGVSVPAWNSLCTEADTKLCTTALVSQNSYNATTGQTDLGEIKVGDGRIRIAGEMFPDPIYSVDAGGDVRFGLASYALTYTAYIVFDNLVDWSNPYRSDLPQPPFTTTLTFAEGSATSGNYTDASTVGATLLDHMGAPMAGAPITLELSDADGTFKTLEGATDSAGLASFNFENDVVPGDYGMVLTYAGADKYLPSSTTQSFTVRKELTITDMTIERDADGKRMLSVALADDDGQALGNRLLTLFADGAQMKQVATNRDGFLTFVVPDRFAEAAIYQATFGGDDLFEASSNSVDATGV